MMREWPPRMRAGAVVRGCSGDGAAAGPGPDSDRSVEKMRVRERTPPATKRRVTAIKRNNRKQPTQLLLKSMSVMPRPETPLPVKPVPVPLATVPEDDGEYYDIPLHAAILPVLGSLLLTICWGYELYLSTPALRKFVRSLFR